MLDRGETRKISENTDNRPILLASTSVNHSAPSGPTVIPAGPALAAGIENSVTKPVVVMRLMLLARSVNHSAPSGPVVIPRAVLPTVGIGNNSTAPAVVTRPIFAPSTEVSVNHSAPSGPVVICWSV